MASRTLHVDIVGDASSLQRAFGQAEKSTSRFGSKLGALAKGALIGGAVGGVALLGKTLFDSVGAAQEAEKAQARLQAAMKSANVSYGEHGDAIEKAIEKTSRLAALDDEDLSDAFAKMVRSTGDVQKSMEGMALAADIARARNISLEAASKTVEKGLLGQTASWRKIGVEIEKGTSSTEAFEQAQKQFAGSAEAYGKTAGAAQERLGVAFENLQERLGQKLLPVVVKVGEAFVRVIEWAEKNWPKVERAIAPIVERIRSFGDEAKAMWDIVRPVLAVAIPAAFKLIGAAIEVNMEIWKVLARVIGTVVSGILTVIDKFLGGVQAIAEAASKLPFVGDKFKGIAEAVGNAREKVRGLQTSIDNLRSKSVTITTTLETVYRERHESLPGSPIGRRAHGGPVIGGRPYLVGERGPEVFRPTRSGTIIPNHALGGGVVVNVYGDVTGEEVIRKVHAGLVRWQRRNGSLGFT